MDSRPRARYHAVELHRERGPKMGETKSATTHVMVRLIRLELWERKLTQKAFAQQLGVSESYVSMVMTGFKCPSAIWLDKMAAALGMEWTVTLTPREDEEVTGA